MCFLRDVFKVSLLLSVVVSWCAGEPCDVRVTNERSLTFNCSRRGIDQLPTSWPQEIQDVDQDANILITFFNNSISNLKELPAIDGARVAVNFKFNRIVEIEAGTFQNINQLIYLDLGNNYISGEVLRSEIFQGRYEDGVYSKIALETLNLGHNEIHSLDRYLFQLTPNLSRLYLNDNPIEILDHVTILALSSATNLEVLDLSNTDIDSIPLDAFKSLSNLQQIDLSSNRFVTVPEALRYVGATLKYLTFNNNPITELNDDSFVGLTNLTQLEVAENDNLEEVKRSSFTPLKSLRVLHLCHNANLRYISHNAFRGLKEKWTLQEVYLDDNNLSELSTDLMPWQKLQTLGMMDNDWLCNCDLANIVTKQEAGSKFRPGEVPICGAPMRWSGVYVTNVTLSYCPQFDTTFAKKKFSMSDLKPRHVLWSIFGVAMVAFVGMLIGLLFRSMKSFYDLRVKSQQIRYINLTSDA